MENLSFSALRFQGKESLSFYNPHLLPSSSISFFLLLSLFPQSPLKLSVDGTLTSNIIPSFHHHLLISPNLYKPVHHHFLKPWTTTLVVSFHNQTQSLKSRDWLKLSQVVHLISTKFKTKFIYVGALIWMRSLQILRDIWDIYKK